MSNGLSGETQFISNYEQDKKDTMKAKKITAFRNYVRSYIETTAKKSCTCSACKTENAIRPIKIGVTPNGVEEVWKCASCGRVVPKMVTTAELSYRLNVDRQNVTA